MRFLRRSRVTAARLGRAALAALAAVGASHAVRGQTVQQVGMTPDSGVTMHIANLAGELPAQGFAPMRITINNTSASNGVWRIQSQCSSGGSFGPFAGQQYGTEMYCEVPAGTERVFEIMAPLPPRDNGSYRYLTTNISGRGVERPSMGWSANIRPPSGAPATTTKKGIPVKKVYGGGTGHTLLSDVMVFYALSPGLARAHGDDITDYMTNICRRPYSQVSLAPGDLSGDWRAYTGYDVIFYTPADWLEVPAAARLAILEWVATGGEVRFIGEAAGLGLPPHEGERYGAGFLRVFAESELEDYDYATANFEPEDRTLLNAQYGRTRPAAFPLAKGSATGPYSFNVPRLEGSFWPAAVVILIFGIVVGPVNLFWFCRGSHRPRLLWVTPLISIVTALVLGGFILISEGVGGTGIFYRVTVLEPQGKFQAVTESLSYKTGLLFSRDFQLPDPAWLVVKIEPKARRESLSEAGVNYSGDWIGSRREQTLNLVTASPSRAAVRLAAGAGSPSLTSEYNGMLESVFYRDAAGKAWKCARLGNGQTAKLEAATNEEFLAAWNEHCALAPDEIRENLWRLSPQPGTFFALSTDDPTSYEPKIYGLRWTCFRHVVTGQVEK